MHWIRGAASVGSVERKETVSGGAQARNQGQEYERGRLVVLVHVCRLLGPRGGRAAPVGHEPRSAPRRAPLRAVGRGRRDRGGLLHARGSRRPPLSPQHPRGLALLFPRPRRGGAPIRGRVRRLLACGGARLPTGRRGVRLGWQLAIGAALRPVRLLGSIVPRRSFANPPLAPLRLARRRGGRGGERRGGLLARTDRLI